MGESNSRERLRKRRQRERLRSRLIWGGAAGVVVALLAVFAWLAFRPAIGEEIELLPGTHVLVGEPTGPYNSDPPTSGSHYDAPVEAGFYDEERAGELGQYPEGHLVHNLEHGYVIFWYNCDLIEESDCSKLTNQLMETLDDARNLKVIAFPWSSLDVPVVATSWGRMLEFEQFDPRQARSFINRNRNKAPEPQAR